MALGPVIIDLQSFQLTSKEEERLQHPLVGGIILFARNYRDIKQLATLVQSVRAIRDELIICVDHEGGRVQRFDTDFTALPPQGRFNELIAAKKVDELSALEAATNTARIMAMELSALQIDLSLSPVLDINFGNNDVIGTRAFSGQVDSVVSFANCYLTGMKQCGMSAVGKHFPGHGFVKDDSHAILPIDGRSLDELQEDLIPFTAMIKAGIKGLMTGHLLYPEVDNLPVSFSKVWLTDILRQKLQFNGAIISDDLAMGAAHSVGQIEERAQKAIDAGCDAILVCNEPNCQDGVLSSLKFEPNDTHQARLQALKLQAVEVPKVFENAKAQLESVLACD